MSGSGGHAGADGITPDERPLLDDHAADEKQGPPSGLDDGKAGGASQGGRIGMGTFAVTGGRGTNAQRGGSSGSETEHNAPGAATGKKSDDIS